mmetsp:Transcript_28396/g.64958  ORF Transcript_28396/g.64958 Transcript_28396/m.64958 type:complete len:206 (+) Transcript_28396:868-1485(+)
MFGIVPLSIAMVEHIINRDHKIIVTSTKDEHQGMQCESSVLVKYFHPSRQTRATVHPILIEEVVELERRKVAAQHLSQQNASLVRPKSGQVTFGLRLQKSPVGVPGVPHRVVDAEGRGTDSGVLRFVDDQLPRYLAHDVSFLERLRRVDSPQFAFLRGVVRQAYLGFFADGPAAASDPTDYFFDPYIGFVERLCRVCAQEIIDDY